MQITLLSTYDNIGGAAIACRRLWEALREQNVKVNFLVQEGRAGKKITGVDYLVKGPISRKFAQARLLLNKLCFFPYDKNKGLNFAFEAPFWGVQLSKLPLVQKSDILHFHWVNHGFVSFNTLKSLQELKKKIIWTLHDMWAFTGGCYYSQHCDHYKMACGNCFFLKSPSSDDFSHRVWHKKKEIYKQLDLTVVTCSQWLAQCAAQSTLLGDKKILNIPNPINTAIFKPGNRELIRQKLNLPNDQYLLLFASAKIEDKRKGFDYLQKALQQLRITNSHLGSKISLILLGKGGNFAVNNINDYPVYYLGNLATEKEMAEAYNACDVFISPSIADNLPNTIMEAMACGIPPIAFAIGGIPEMIIHRKNGYLVPPFSVEQILVGIEFMLSDKQRYATMQRAAVDFVLQNYSYPIIAKRYLELYEEVLG